MPTPDFSSRTIIVTGDDFGRCAEINAAVMRYHRAGVLHRTSLMVAEPAAPQAAALARECPSLRVGLHLSLCDGRATQPSPLTDARGYFSKSPAVAGLRYAFLPALRPDLESEIRRQFEAFLALGLAPAYWDGHAHLHLHPVVLRIALPIAAELGFRETRLVREPGPPALLPGIFHLLSRSALPALQHAGVAFSERVFGLRRTGHMSLAAFREAIRQAGPGETEIYFHPGAEANPPDPADLATLLKNRGA
jgi:hopanoid biosynthesis associated protein HpnK